MKLTRSFWTLTQVELQWGKIKKNDSETRVTPKETRATPKETYPQKSDTRVTLDLRTSKLTVRAEQSLLRQL